MKRYFTILLVCLFTSSFSFGQDAAELCSQGKIKAFSQLNKISQIQYPGDSKIDVTYYKLNLTIKTNPNWLDGIVTIKAKPTSNGLLNFYLDLVNALAVSSIKLGGANLLFSQSNNQLLITLTRQFNLGEEFSIDITYSGVPTSGSGFISNASFLFYDQAAGKQVVASLSEPYGARDWWPSKDTPADKVDSSDVWITADKFFVSVSNGKLIETVDNPDETRTYKWKNHYPIANYLISIAMTNYQTIDDQYEYSPNKFIPVIHYCYPERIDATRRTAVAKTINMLKIFSEKFGPYPYPKEKYGHAEFSWGGGMEHQTITSMGGGAMNSENTIAHELAHQWFGDKVTCKDWQNIWLNEGFASYSECVYREAAYGTADFKAYVNNFMNIAKTANGTIYVQYISSVSEIFNSARSYKKGAIVLHMLRGIVGDDKFFQILREYLTEPGLSYNVATTEDFQRVAERVYGQSLDYFFKEWIYGEGYPKYTVGWNYKLVSGDTYEITFRLKQNSNTNPVFFKMPVQVKVSTANGTVLKTFLNEQQEQGWVFNVEGSPTSLTFDPDNWILKNIVAYTGINNLGTIPLEYSLYQNYPNPFNPSTVISYQLPFAGHVSLKVFDLLGREIATLVNGEKEAGTYSVSFDTRHSELGSLSSGVYFYHLSAGGFIEIKKMIILK